jgi:hypothetical protein
MNSNTIRVVLVAVLILTTAGRLGDFPDLHGDRPWTLTLYISEEEQVDGTIQITAEVGLDGAYQDDTVVTDVRVCAVDGDGNEAGTATAGDITGTQPRVNVTLRLDHPPAQLLLNYDAVEADSSYSVEGLERLDERRYSTIDQEGPRCDG